MKRIFVNLRITISFFVMFCFAFCFKRQVDRSVDIWIDPVLEDGAVTGCLFFLLTGRPEEIRIGRERAIVKNSETHRIR
jgi:hypothetical protein